MSYILTGIRKPSVPFKGYPIEIDQGGTGSADPDGSVALNNLIVSGGGAPDKAVKSLITPEWGDPLILDPDPTFAVIQIVDFLSLLGVCNQ